MGDSHTCSRLLVLLLLIASLLALRPNAVCSLSSKDHILRRSAAEGPTGLKGPTGVVVGFDAKKRSEAAPPLSFDPDQSSQRRVRRGSDPIHNRS